MKNPAIGSDRATSTPFTSSSIGVTDPVHQPGEDAIAGSCLELPITVEEAPFGMNSLERFLKRIKRLVQRCQSNREGQLSLRCKRGQNNAGEKGFWLLFSGFARRSTFVHQQQLADYLAQRSGLNVSQKSSAFEHFEAGLVEILQRSGHGQVMLEFTRGKRQGTIFVCSVTISQREVI